VDARTDIYALGITAFEMATGRRPFPDDICETLRCHITRPTPDPRACDPDLPEEFCEFVARATNKEPKDRFQDMKSVIRKLRDMLRSKEHDRGPGVQRRRMMSVFVFYDQAKRPELNRLIEDFGRDAGEMGAEIHIAELENV
jgi:serine/threonine protein kinase